MRIKMYAASVFLLDSLGEAFSNIVFLFIEIVSYNLPCSGSTARPLRHLDHAPFQPASSQLSPPLSSSHFPLGASARQPFRYADGKTHGQRDLEPLPSPNRDVCRQE